MRPIARSTLTLSSLLLAFAAVPAMAQMSPPPQNLGAMHASRMTMAQMAPAPADAPIARPGNDIGTGQSLPLSNNAGNISPSDTKTPYAARLPDPDVADNAAPRAFLEAARQALAANRTGVAQEALERAETRLLIRSVRPSQAGTPSREPAVQQITEARQALGMNDHAGAMAKIDAALENPELAMPAK